MFFAETLTFNGYLDASTVINALPLALWTHISGKLGYMSSYELTYAAKACALEKSALITLLAFNLFCSLITENSARTRSLFQPNVLSNPKRPHEWLFGTFVPVVLGLHLRSYVAVVKFHPQFAGSSPPNSDFTPADAFQNVPVFNFKCANYIINCFI